MGQQLLQRQLDKLPVPPGHQHGEIGGELIEHLAAGAAGPAVVLAPARHGQGGKLPVPLADGLHQGGALRADGGAVGGIFHIAAGEHRAVGTEQRRANGKVGIGHVGAIQHGKGQIHQGLVGHIKNSFPIWGFFGKGSAAGP